ncbi:hypothetical protein PCYB_003240 [Plasmodium cynomolgi strain B]|uniref:Methyltransferase n=1 Tax=Plasmodium cynomolgi (strain B) TaxID=1120755 RepID=K6V2R8_PLACD|nr:hypothetical protein PCYB_003240 [Plasmodium cynomolgi strain B]GAB69575.1 hypothetical protein PCYB_003240 [Plasmodium cynomolgi strain B]
MDMIRFLLYECAIGHNQLNSTLRSCKGSATFRLPFIWQIISTVERKKKNLYEHMRKDFLQISLVKNGYQLSVHVKNKINPINFFGSIFSDDHDGSLGNGDSRQGVGGATLNGKVETLRKQIRLYKEANKIDLLKKNESKKSILSEAFNAPEENILHLVLSHTMSSVLDEQDGRAVNGMCRGVAKRGDSIHNSHKDTAFTKNLEDAKIIQECTQQLLINEKAKVKNRESEKEAIIRIREIGLNYFGNSFEDRKTSGEEVHSHNDITGINILECCLMISKWFSDLCLQNRTLFSNKMELELVIIDVNTFTLNNISHNVLLNEELIGHLDSAWRSKVKIYNIDWTNENTKPRENEKIVTYYYIIGNDLIYDKKILPSLIHLINITLKTNGIYLYVCRKNRDGSHEFFDQLKNESCDIQLFTPRVTTLSAPSST